MREISVDWTRLWQLASEQFVLDGHSIHGPAHWRAVERNAIELTAATGADVLVVRLFAVLHDSKRENESYDPGHGPRAAEWAMALRDTHFRIDDDQLERLTIACIGHDRGTVSDDPTIGTCWDADRLELTRVGICPDARYFSTEEGRRRARQGWPFVR